MAYLGTQLLYMIFSSLFKYQYPLLCGFGPPTTIVCLSTVYL